jgi:4-diphosphocytidyl-2-C-methyl-D-erythritol kinase
MLTYPNAKINLGLNVTEKRNDGYHNLETVFIPVPWYDALEIVPADETRLFVTGAEVTGNPEENLILKVYRKMELAYALSPVEIHLHKNIPMGAGLGGGSADAAFAAKALNELFNLNLENQVMEELVRPLGSDCAFFIRNKTTFAYEKGDRFEALPEVLKGYHLILVYPGIHVSTALAYSGVTPQKPAYDLKSSIQLPVENWQTLIVNDFEKSVFKQFPEIAQIKQTLYDSGAVYASMSGSGSAVFGIFKEAKDVKFPATYRIQKGIV